MPQRIWASVESPSGRESAFTRLRHVLDHEDPYSGFGETVCGKATTASAFHKSDADVREAQERDGIPPNLCPKCDRATGGWVVP